MFDDDVAIQRELKLFDLGDSIPRCAATFAANVDSICGVLEEPDMLATVIADEPAPPITVRRTDLDRVCRHLAASPT